MFNRLNPEARIAVMQAIDEARELGHTEVGPDHVLLGLLANVRGETYALLNTHGLEFNSARTIVIDRHPVSEATTEAEPGNSADADSVRAATELDEDRAALRAIGIDLDKVRDAVRSAFGDDITAEWGERSRRGRGRGPDGRGGRRGGPRGHHHRHHHHEGRAESVEGDPTESTRTEGDPEDRRGRGGRGRRGPRSERFGDRIPFSPSLRDAMRATVREARLGLPDEDRRGPGGGRLTAGMLLLAISRSNDPAVDAVFKWANDEAALRSAIAEQAGQPVS